MAIYSVVIILIKVNVNILFGKQFLCTKCGPAFLENRCFIIHLITHTGEKTYQCRHCVKALLQIGYLILHIGSDTWEDNITEDM